MPFPTHSWGEEDLWFVCLLRGAAKGDGSLMIFLLLLFFRPLSGCLLGRHLPRTAAEGPPVPCIPMRQPGLLAGMLPGGKVNPQLVTSLCRAKAPQLPAQLLRACHGPNAGSPRSQQANSGHSKSAPCFILPWAAGRSCGVVAARMAVTDVTANRLRRNTASSSSSSAPAFLNLLPFLTLTQSCNTGHLLHYHILGEFGEGGMEEGSWRWG